MIPENTLTSATKSVSSSLREHASPKASIRSFNNPLLGNVIVNVAGRAVPSVLRTVKVIVRVVVEGNGKGRCIKGSKVIETFLQTGHTNVERN